MNRRAPDMTNAAKSRSNPTVSLWLLPAFAAALSLAVGCSSDQYADGGIGGSGYTVTSVGLVSDVGAAPTASGVVPEGITVNGVTYDARLATIIIEGETNPAGATIDPGMVIRVTGSVNANGTTGSATVIEYADDFEGPIAARSGTEPDLTLTVLGQTVRVDANTTLVAPLVIGELIPCTPPCAQLEINGLLRDDGSLLATRIERKGQQFQVNSTEVEVKGFIKNLVLGSSFQIGGLTINYDSSVLDPPGLTLTEDLYVEVKGTLSSAGSPLTATRVEVEDDITDATGSSQERVEIEGFVTAVSGSDFTIGASQAARVGVYTTFQNGTLANLVVGARVEAKGARNGTVLEATRVEFK